MAIDPDVPAGACICRSDDNIMAMGHAHYCVANARRQPFGTRLPAAVEQILIDVAADPSHQAWRRRRLDFNGDGSMRDAFMQALESPEIKVFRDQCEDDPEEIVVRGRGATRSGSYWSSLNIILLDPWWSKNAQMSEALAEDICAHWERLQAAIARNTTNAAATT